MPATSGAPDQGTDAPPLAAGSAVRWRRVFPGDQPQLAVLRRWLTSLLPDCLARSDVVCVATELGTNAVQHTATGRGGWFAVEITCYGTVMRVAVADCGGPAEPQVIQRADGEHGRGLALVQGLALQTGYSGDHHGRLVWADLPWDQAVLVPLPHAAREPARGGQNGQNGSWHAEAASLSA